MPSRRQFLKLAGISSLGAVIFKACGFADREILVQSPVELPEDLVSGTDNWYASTCGQCPAGCGIVTRVMEGRAKKIEGNPNHPISRGKLCVRGHAGLQALYHPDRINGPKRLVGARGSGEYEDISWDQARRDLAAQIGRFSRGQMLLVTEPLRGQLAKVARRFADGVGSRYAAYETMERTTNLRGAMKELYNEERLPEFDLENTRYLLSFGADMLETWLSTVRYNRGYGAMQQGKDSDPSIVAVDSRFSMTAANADEWVYVNPGMEGLLALSMAHVIVDEGLGDSAAASAMTKGEGVERLQAFDPNTVADEIGVSSSKIVSLARDFAHNQPSLAIGGNSAAAHTNGTFNLMAIYALNTLVGSVGKKGGMYFNPEPPLSGMDKPPPTTFKDWQGIVDGMRDGNIKLMMVRGANPVYGLPAKVGLPDALSNVEFIASFSSFMDETTAQADLIMPDHTYLESWGDDVPEPGPGYETVSYQQPAVKQFYNTSAFGDELIAVAKQLGGRAASALPWNTFKDALREGARELQALNRGSVQSGDFETFWLGLLRRGVWYDLDSKPSKEVNLAELPQKAISPAFESAPGDKEFNLVLYQSLALTDGRGASLPWLQATPDPITTVVWDTWVDLSMADAERLSVKTNDIVEIRSLHGSLEAPAYVNPGSPPGTVSMPVGQGHQGMGRYAENRGTNPISILAPFVDVHTGTLAWNATKVRVTKTSKERTLPKFEGTVVALPAPETDLIQIQGSNGGSGESH